METLKHDQRLRQPRQSSDGCVVREDAAGREPQAQTAGHKQGSDAQGCKAGSQGTGSKESQTLTQVVSCVHWWNGDDVGLSTPQWRDRSQHH